MNYKALMLSVMFASTCMIEPATKKELRGKIAELSAKMKVKIEDRGMYERNLRSVLEDCFEERYKLCRISYQDYQNAIKNMDIVFSGYVAKMTEMFKNGAPSADIHEFIEQYTYDDSSYIQLMIYTVWSVIGRLDFIDLQIELAALTEEYLLAE